MATLFGTSYTRDELLQRVGDISQFAGVRVGELSDGFERGVRVVDFRTGTGFEFTVLVDRGMDIGWATFAGASISWRSPTTAIGPVFFEPEGRGWLRGFHGGLMNTCGLTYMGAPCHDEGQALGLHGRASYTPASYFAHGGDWNGDEYEMWITGQLRETMVFGEYIVLRRRIVARLGESRLFVEDTVTNEGYQTTPHMILYHVNFGFPVVSEHTELLSASAEVKPRDEIAAAGLGQYNRFQPPTPGYQEQVFYHTPKADTEGYAQAALVNRSFGDGQGLGGYVRFSLDELPRLVQWKMMDQTTYVCGLEPSTNRTEGRDKERAEGRLQFLEPGETRHYKLEIGVLTSQEEIDAFAARLPGS
ncbi:MAG: aldose 1-epimerase family protein [Candidatus Bipolaricaulia bacterium]